VEVPVPTASGPQLVVQSHATVVSSGTERMLVEFGRANLIEKARRQPEKVRQVIDKVRTDGLAPTLAAVRAKLDAPIPLGYCQAGVVVEVGSRVERFAVGDRVVTNGPHAEYVRVPHTLAARMPEGVSSRPQPSRRWRPSDSRGCGWPTRRWARPWWCTGSD
jgi:hypothetical protein